jgi:hypothetical protein
MSVFHSLLQIELKISHFNGRLLLVGQSFLTLQNFVMRHPIKFLTTLGFCSLIILASCKKDNGDNDSWANKLNGHLKQTKTFSSDVAQKWVDLQVRMLRLPAGPNIYGRNGHRYFLYSGIALYESVVGGMPSYQSLSGQLKDMPAMPTTEPGKAYHWPSSANAALAYLTRNYFTSASAEQKGAIDSLENALNQQYKSDPDVDSAEYQRSVTLGKTVAERIFDWSATDGSGTVYPLYVPPAGPGLWAPTPPNFPQADGPYWGLNRPMVVGALDGTWPPAPPTYSTNPSSVYYAMVKEVYDVSQTLTPEQTAIGLYYRDNPGFVSGTHYIYMFHQIMRDEDPQLDFYALAYAKYSVCYYESFRGCWTTKYTYNVERPIRYIREVLNHPTWSPLFNTPGHPDYPSGHSTNAAVFATVFSDLFGPNYSFTLHTYDNLGMAPRHYNSFDEMVTEIAKARLYAGIHYSLSCSEGNKQGKKIAENILNMVKFKK